MKKHLLQILIYLVISGCEFQETEPQPNTKETSTESDIIDISIENGYLVFKDNEHFRKGIDLLNKMTSSEFKKWESKVGFKSFETTISTIFNVNTTQFDFNSIKESGLIIIDSANTEIPIKMNITDMLLVRIVDSKRIVKIGNAIHQYSWNNLKILVDGASEKIEYLDEITHTQKNLGIYVEPINRYQINHNNARSMVEDYSQSCSDVDGPSSSGDYKIIVTESYSETYTEYNDTWEFYHSATITSYRIAYVQIFPGFYFPQPVPYPSDLKLDVSVNSAYLYYENEISDNNWVLNQNMASYIPGPWYPNASYTSTIIGSGKYYYDPPYLYSCVCSLGYIF